MSKKLWSLIAVLMIATMVISACAPAATPAPTQAPAAKPTDVPATKPTDVPAVKPTDVPAAPAKQFTFGMILVGPQNDKGWSQAHFEAGQYLEQKLGAKMITIDKVNPADRPGTTVDQVAADMIAQGAQMIFATSDDMKDGALLAAENNPKIPMIWASGDSAWEQGKAYAKLPNLGN